MVGSPPGATPCPPWSAPSRSARGWVASLRGRPGWCGRSTGSTSSSRGSATASFAAWTRPRRRRVRPRDEGPERLEVPAVARIPSGELEASGHFAEALLVHEESERLLSELPPADVLVAVELRSEVAHGIVQMERADPTHSDGLIDRAEQRIVAVPRSEVVPGGEGVAGVDANPEAIRMRGALHHFGELLEPIADDGAGARRVLEDREDIRGVRVLETPVQTRRDHLDGVGLASPHVGSRVEDDVPDSQELGPVELLHERNAAVRERVVVRSREVDQIVRMDDRACDAVRGHRLAERGRIFRRDGLRPAEHPRAAGENLDRVGADGLAALRRQCDALRDGDVGAEEHAPPRGNRLRTDELADLGATSVRALVTSSRTRPRASAPSRPDTTGSVASRPGRTNPRVPPSGRPRPIVERPNPEGTARPRATRRTARRSCRRP